MNLYQKIIEIKKIAEGFTKDTEGFNYKYVSGSQVLNKITDKMNEIGLLFMPVETKARETREFNYTKKGQEQTDFIVEGELYYEWINAENPEERQLIKWQYYGQQNDISKAFGSALTYSERYALLKCLGLPTDADDPDKRNTTEKVSRQYHEEYQQEIKDLISGTDITVGKVAIELKEMFGVTKVGYLTAKQYKEFYNHITEMIEARIGK